MILLRIPLEEEEQYDCISKLCSAGLMATSIEISSEHHRSESSPMFHPQEKPTIDCNPVAYLLIRKPRASRNGNGRLMSHSNVAAPFPSVRNATPNNPPHTITRPILTRRTFTRSTANIAIVINAKETYCSTIAAAAENSKPDSMSLQHEDFETPRDSGRPFVSVSRAGARDPQVHVL